MKVKDVPPLAGFHLWKPANLSLDVPVGLSLQEVGFLSVLLVSTHLPVTYFLGLTFLRSTRSKTSLSFQDLFSWFFASTNCL